MKKLLFVVFYIFLLFSIVNVNAFNKSKVLTVMDNFYSKLDTSLEIVEDRINKLDKINNKIKEIKETKWDKLSDNNKNVLNLVELSIEKRIIYYNSLLEDKSTDFLFNILEENSNEKEKILQNIKEAKGIWDLFNLQNSINFYCQKVYDKTKDFKKEQECKKELYKELRVSWDKIKEELILSISNMKGWNKFNKIYQLHAILNAWENAYGEWVLFSTDNIAWAHSELKKMADERLLSQVEDLSSLSWEELVKKSKDLLVLIKAFETASWAEGIYLSNHVIKEAKDRIGNLLNQRK